MLQPIIQVDAGKSLCSSVNTKLTLERVTKVLHSKATDSSSVVSKPSLTSIIADGVVKAKWTKLLKLSRGGCPSIAASPTVAKKIKASRSELCNGDIRFSKSPRFRKHYEEFLAQFLGGVETYQQNCEKIAILVVSGKNYQSPQESTEEINDILRANQNILRALLDELTNLAAREADLKKKKLAQV